MIAPHFESPRVVRPSVWSIDRLAIWLVLIASGPTLARAADWPQWRGPTRDGVSTEAIDATRWPATGPEVAWEAQVGIGFASVSVSEGRAYTAGHVRGKDVVWCLDVDGGVVLWKREYEAELGDDLHEGGPGATPTVAGGRVYTIDKQGMTLCLDARSGDVVWKRDLKREAGVRPNEWGLAGSPLVWNDRIILNVGPAGMALDRRTGKTVWSSGKKDAGYASPIHNRPAGATADSVLVFAGNELVGVDPSSGRVGWRHPWRTGYDNNNADPIVSGRRILISTYDLGAACLEPDGASVAVRWKTRAIFTHMAPPVLVGEHIYGFSGHHARRPGFRCVHVPSGELRWQQRDFPAGSILSAGGALVILDGKGELVIARADPQRFAPIARARVLRGRCWTPPALANGRLYVRNAQGLLKCLSVGADTKR